MRRATEALNESGDGFAISNSHGTALLPAEADRADVALRLADQRMYARKNARPQSAGSQARDVLVGVLNEREPELHDHVLDVGQLAVAVGRRLGMPEESLPELLHGAELHDVGKIGLPESILRKPGPLDDAEWEFMRRHTLIGERFLLAVPALRNVAVARPLEPRALGRRRLPRRARRRGRSRSAPGSSPSATRSTRW